MFELVTTVAQDLQMLKMQNAVDKIQHTLHTQSGASSSANITPFAAVGGGSTDPIIVDRIGYLSESSNQNRIVVSDDEGSFGDEDSDDDNSTLEEFDSDVEDDHSADEIEITEICESNSDSPIDVELFMEDGGNDVNDVDSDGEEERDFVDIDDNVETKHIDISEPVSMDHFEPIHSSEPSTHIVVNKLETCVSPVPFSLDDQVESISTNAFTENVPSSATKPKRQRSSRTSTAEDVDDLEDFNGDYSKLNVTQLRKIVTDRGLSTHATKLKKTEMLQLLGAGVGVGVGGVSSVSVVELDGLELM